MKKKHSWQILITLIALIAVLAACGNNDKASSGKPKTQTVTDALKRKVTIPKDPKKIVALQNVAEISILGTPAIGTTDEYKTTYPAETKNAESIGGDKPNIEKIAKLAPDLIIISDYQKDMIENLEKIAPVYATHFGDTPDQHLEKLAKLLNREKEKDAWYKKYNATLKKERAKLKAAGITNKKAAVFQFYGKDIYIHDQNIFSGLYDKGAGFKPTAAAAKNKETKAISQEAIPNYAKDADYIFILAPIGGSDASVKDLLNGVWKVIPAVKAKHVYLVENKKWSDYTIATRLYQLKDSVAKVTGK